MHTVEELPIINCHLVGQIFGAHRIRKFPLFQRLGPPVLARSLWIIIWKYIRISKPDKLNAVKTWRRGFWRCWNTLKLWFYPGEKKPLLLMLTCLHAFFIVTIITLINSTDWKTWTMANKIQWQLTCGGSLLRGPGSSLETVPFPWQTCKKFCFPLEGAVPRQVLASWFGCFANTMAGVGSVARLCCISTSPQYTTWDY